MCGIAGFVGGDLRGADAVLTAMADAILHRGPDSSGIWIDSAGGCGLAHRRLAILDLSQAGHQPMRSDSGRFMMVFNGEIYNHQEMREALGNRVWRGHSDTETLLAGFEAWGIESTLKKTVGMFAIALWDTVERVLHLARDRVGEKPLYYGWAGDVMLFGSELKALRRHPAFDAKVDRGALSLFLRHNYVPAPYSIWQGISKLAPGTMLSMRFGDGVGAARSAVPQAWWSFESVARSAVSHAFKGDATDAVDELERLLSNSVRLQQIADVPLGAFLSGGVDSSLIVGLMQKIASRPVKTFTIGFNEAAYNEAEHAKAVASHLGTEHHELYVTPGDALDVIPRLASLYDEPFSDSSQIPTYLLSRFVREHVSVSLSGDAGDELFGGYSRYFFARSLWGTMSRIPRAGRRFLAGTLNTLPPSFWDGFSTAASPFLPKRLRVSHTGEKAHRLSRILAADRPEALYLDLVSHWQDPAAIVIDGHEPPSRVSAPAINASDLGIEHYMMALDTMTYLPDDILVKVDRAAMGVGLETRVPFLDHRVVEFAWTLPLEMKLESERGKKVVRNLLDRYVPRSLIERPKQGFGVPIGQWLRGPLRDWAEALLDPSKMRQQGYLRTELIQRKWAEHQSGVRDWHFYLWDVLMFQAWLEETDL
jgi:asparagine synthase (glutamine-hydrolysing)